MNNNISGGRGMDENIKVLGFPQGFLWGCSTAAYQIEGGIVNDWSRWEQKRIDLRLANGDCRLYDNETPEQIENRKSKIENLYTCGSACSSWEMWEDDQRLLQELNCNAYRFGVEWARIEPSRGDYDAAAIARYREMLIGLRQKGIKAFVCLWHWTNPTWVADQGGWANKQTIRDYLFYVEHVVRELGDVVDGWLTMNEPMVPLGFGYLKGTFPPGHFMDIIGAIKKFRNLSVAHNQAYKKIKEISPDYLVGFTNITDYFEPYRRWNLFDQLFNSMFRFFHHRLMLKRLTKNTDFVGLNYYFHNRISAWPPFKRNENKEVNDMGWEIYPEGIYHVVKYAQRFKKPIYIFENGIADRDDDQRPQFIIDHLRWLHRAIAEGADVRGYFHWSLMDNFEWAHGFTQKFGLYEVDFDICERRPRPSAKVYGEICKKNSL